MLFKFFYIITFFFLVSCSSNKITNHLVHLNEKDTQNIPTYQTQCNEKKNYGCRDLIKAMYQSEKIQEAYQLAELYCQKGVKEGCGSLGNLYTYDGEMKKGVEIYQKGCEQKDGYSCALLAWVQFANDEVDLAFKYGNIACEKGYGPGCEIAWNALSNRQNKKEADSYIKKMWDRCETKKEGEICFFVKIYGKEIKREKINTTMQELCEKNQYNYACIAILYSDAGTSDEARVKVIKEACDKFKYIDACYQFSLWQKNIGNNELHTKYLEKACEYGAEEACDYLGRINYNNKNYLAAEKYFRRACNSQKSQSCMYLGFSLAQLGDRKGELIYLEKDCFLKNPVACNQLTIEYANDHNDLASEQFAIKACDLKNGFGCYSLGVKKHKEKKVEDAIAYFKKSCNESSAYGCLGLCLTATEKGNLEEAKSYYLKACESGDLKNQICSLTLDVKENKSISSKDLRNKCHYDPKQPWWHWAALAAIGILSASVVK